MAVVSMGDLKEVLDIPILVVDDVYINNIQLFVIKDNNTNQWLQGLYDNKNEAMDALIGVAKEEMDNIAYTMSNRVNSRGNLIKRGAWTKDAKEKYDCYKKIVDEYNANQETYNSAFNLLLSRGYTEDDVYHLLEEVSI